MAQRMSQVGHDLMAHLHTNVSYLMARRERNQLSHARYCLIQNRRGKRQKIPVRYRTPILSDI
jgi:hypothetical protein